MKKKITAIVGSLRENSCNRQLAMMAIERIGARADVEILEYGDVPLFNQDAERPAPASVKRVRDAVRASDGVWFFTPEYNHSYPGVLKNLVDWLSRPANLGEKHVLAGKPAAFSGVGMGISGTTVAQDLFVALISFLDMRVMNAPRVTIPNAHALLDEGGNLSLGVGAAFLDAQVEAFLQFIGA
ncbi:MAG: NADPH-dependent FMN reductase [Christensenellales bacterium]|jgi:chromate reductase